MYIELKKFKCVFKQFFELALQVKKENFKTKLVLDVKTLSISKIDKNISAYPVLMTASKIKNMILETEKDGAYPLTKEIKIHLYEALERAYFSEIDFNENRFSKQKLYDIKFQPDHVRVSFRPYYMDNSRKYNENVYKIHNNQISIFELDTDFETRLGYVIQLKYLIDTFM